MSRDEIIDFVMANAKGKTGLAAVGPIIDQIVNFISWQQDHIEILQQKVKDLENKQ